MNENDALKKFYECAGQNDLNGCLDALKHISIDTLNRQDDDGYDMLIQAVVAENVCAVTALLQDKRCDWTHEDELCGMTAEEFAMDYPEDSPIQQAFFNNSAPAFIYRNGNVIRKSDVYDRIMDGSIEPDRRNTGYMADYYFARLYVDGKITKEEFESWRGDPRDLYWEAHIVLLIEDEEYGRQLVDWDFIRGEAEPDEWLSFLRDLPQYAGEADWDKLSREGSEDSWQALLEVCPELAEKRIPGIHVGLSRNTDIYDPGK